MSERTPRIEIVPTNERYCYSDGKPSSLPHFWRLISANGETLAHSENYATRANARRGVAAFWSAIHHLEVEGLAGEQTLVKS